MKLKTTGCCCILGALLLPVNAARAAATAESFDATTETVGPDYSGFIHNRFVTPVNQVLTPAGNQILLPAPLCPHALALSPDHSLLVTAGLTHELFVIGTQTGKILQRVKMPSAQAREAASVTEDAPDPDGQAQLSFTGLVFSPDGSRIYLSNVRGDIKVFGVSKDKYVSPLFSIALPPSEATWRKAEIPAGIAVSPDGKKLYVALNLSDRLAELDAVTGKVLRLWEVGVAPYDVVVAGKKIYVSNWGGRRPDADSLTGPAGQGTRVRVDPVRYIASEGSVSVIDLDADINHSALRTPHSEILTGLHASALSVSPNEKYLVVANAGSDTLSVIDTRTDQIVETICARQNPGDPFGAQPDALVFDRSGQKLYVCNGTQNAVAVVQFDPGRSQLLGLVPVGWFPGAIVFDASRKQIYVANIKGKPYGSGPYNVSQFDSTLSLVAVPSAGKLAEFTQKALADLRYPLLAQARLPAREGQAVQPVPERVGEPSVFQHVIYIIKENRTYDQVLGDVKAGNGDAKICNFGRRVTPNEHQLVHDFVLLDNTYCCGFLSADGHQWADSALANDYAERSYGSGWPRSYPFSGEDALVLSPTGCIWDDALAHGKTVRDYGEFTQAWTAWKNPAQKGTPDFLARYRDFMGGSNAITYTCVPNVESLRPFMDTNTEGWELDTPDVFRAAQFIKEMKQFEPAGNFPNFMVLWLPSDHTSATRFGSPTPEAQVADNDLALGQIVDAVSHSPFWTNTCIFAVEDDPQAGADHVSGYRTTAYVASAYTRRNTVVSTQYNQTSLLRTMELMLGLPPMNQMDATATPMFDCFTNTPDYTAYDAVTNNVPLDQMNPAPKKIADAQLRKDAYISARLPLAKEDQCPEDLFNHILWRATMGTKPYPDWAVKNVDDD
jgi:YVTN family beta-propeller protein